MKIDKYVIIWYNNSIMGRPSFTKFHYDRFAQERDLVHTAQMAPNSVWDETTWQCNLCGLEFIRSYRNLKMGVPCICRRERSLKAKDYEKLAEKYEIKWDPGEYLPTTATEKTAWIGKDGLRVAASYSDLAWVPIKRIFILLGIEELYWRPGTKTIEDTT